MHATPPPNYSRVHDLVANIRAFDGLARQIWGGDAAATIRLDGTLIRLERAAKLHQAAALRREAAILQKQGSALARSLFPVSAMSQDALQSLKTNLALLKRVTR